MSCKYETENCKNYTHCSTCSYYKVDNIITGQSSKPESSDYCYGTDTFVSAGFVEGVAIEGGTIRVPKVIARIKLCGGALTFNFYDTDAVPFEMPTKEQCENLKKTFGIEVELVDEE